ncbi:MAG: hypothetical protein WCO00_11225 [Rhodospirillaceae bacterium]
MQTEKTAKGIKIVGTNIMLRKRQGSRFWEACIYFPNVRRYKTSSTRTEDIDQAIVVAFEKASELKFMEKHGHEIFKKCFGKVAVDWLTHFEKRVKEGYEKESMLFVYRSAIKVHIAKWFDNVSLGEMTNHTLEEYGKYLIEHNITSAVTFDHHNFAIANILRWAREKGWYKKPEIPKIAKPENKMKQGETRSRFTNHEIVILLENFDNYIDIVKNRINPNKPPAALYNAKLLKAYVWFMLATGCRTNDIRLVKWKNIELRFKEGNTSFGTNPFDHIAQLAKTGDISEFIDASFLNVWLTGKKHERWTQVSQKATMVMTWWWTESLHRDDDDLVFGGYNGKFNDNYSKWLKEYLDFLDIPSTTKDGDRTPYSFRHTFITKKLVEGANPIFIAKSCGTSVEHIQETYCHMLPTELFDKIFNPKNEK